MSHTETTLCCPTDSLSCPELTATGQSLWSRLRQFSTAGKVLTGQTAGREQVSRPVSPDKDDYSIRLPYLGIPGLDHDPIGRFGWDRPL